MSKIKTTRSGSAREIVERKILGRNIVRRVYGDGSCTDVAITVFNPVMSFGPRRDSEAE